MIISRDSSAASLAEQAALLPDEVITVRFKRMTADVFTRQDVRRAFDLARVYEAEVEVYETRGLLSSVFVARLHGTGRQLFPALRLLAELEG